MSKLNRLHHCPRYVYPKCSKWSQIYNPVKPLKFTRHHCVWQLTCNKHAIGKKNSQLDLKMGEQIYSKDQTHSGQICQEMQEIKIDTKMKKLFQCKGSTWFESIQTTHTNIMQILVNVYTNMCL